MFLMILINQYMKKLYPISEITTSKMTLIIQDLSNILNGVSIETNRLISTLKMSNLQTIIKLQSTTTIKSLARKSNQNKNQTKNTMNKCWKINSRKNNKNMLKLNFLNKSCSHKNPNKTNKINSPCLYTKYTPFT